MAKERIRMAGVADAPALLAIYEPFITGTIITFEYESPGLAEFEQRIRDVLRRFPYLVCEEGDGTLAGYAYAHPFAERKAYQWSAELSVYTRPDRAGRGVGRALYSALIELLKLQGIHTVYGIVSHPNPASRHLHESFGFTRAGLMRQVGYKHKQWIDVAWYEKRILEPESEPAEPLRITDLPPETIEAVLSEGATLLR